jgi:hypothetical protein
VCDAGAGDVFAGVGGGVSAGKMSLRFFNVWRGARLQSSPTVVDLMMTTQLG